MDKTNLSEKAGAVKQKMQAQISRLVQMFKESKKVIFIVVSFFVVIVGIFFLIRFSEKKEEAVVAAEMENVTQEEGIAVPEEALEKDAYPEVNNLVKQYYQALVDGDMDTIKSIKNYTDEDEELKILKKSEFIEGYPVITVYTKKGPEEGSYVAYVQYEVKFMNQDVTAPGLNTLYICTDENGNLFINANELEEQVVDYLKSISIQNDVVDLFNTVQVTYNDIKTQNEELSVFLDELPNLLAESVALALEEKEAMAAALNPEEEEEKTEIELVVTKVKTTTVVNVRSSDSIEADWLGRTGNGQVLELIEERLNGWSKVMFEGKEGFIKSEFLEAEETEMVLKENTSEEENVEKTETESVPQTAALTETTSGEKTTPKKGQAIDNVRIREGSSTETNIVGNLHNGQDVEVLELMNNGWTKISYNGGVAYVKSEYIKVLE